MSSCSVLPPAKKFIIAMEISNETTKRLFKFIREWMVAEKTDKMSMNMVTQGFKHRLVTYQTLSHTTEESE